MRRLAHPTGKSHDVHAQLAQRGNLNIRLEPVMLSKEASIDSILSYFMGKNTQQRQEFIIDNLRVEEAVEDDNEELEKAS